jgi:hypothetical protein
MGRLMVAALGVMLAASTAPAATSGHKRHTSSKRATKHAKAKTKHAKAKTKHAKAKKKHAVKRGRVAKKRVRLKTTNKPLITVAVLQVDGRVKYGADRMPPGFAWPPTPQMQTTSKACEQALDELGIVWKRAAAEGKIVDPIVVPSMELGGIKYVSAYRRGPHTLDCQFARDLALLGPELYALGVREIQFGSIYRNTMARSHGKSKDFLSRHALGIAMDVRAFVDEAGRVAVVELEYLKQDPLLHGIEDLINRNTRFRWVLTPGNDPISHYNHFHIEASVDFTGFR